MPSTTLNGLPYPLGTDSADVPRDIKALAEAVDPLVYIIGEIRLFAFAAVPAKWLQCLGQTVLRASYPELYAKIGDVWALGGEAADSFRLPPAAGRALAGSGQGAGLSNRALASRWGAETITLATTQIPAHNHGVSDPTHAHSVYDPGHGHSAGTSYPVYNTNIAGQGQPVVAGGSNIALPRDYVPVGVNGAGTGISIYGAGTGISIQNNGGGQAHDNTPPSLAFLVCIYAGR